MSLVDRLRPDRPPVSSATSGPARVPAPAGWLSALLTGTSAAGLSLLVVALPVLLAWAVSSRTTASWSQALRVAANGWLLLHHVELRVPGGAVSVAPLALSLLPAAACWFAGRRVAAGPPVDDLVPGVRRPGAPAVESLLVPLAALAGGYALVLTCAALLARGDGVRPVVWQALLAGLLLPALVGGTSAVYYQRSSPATTVADLLRLPAVVRRCARPAVLAAAALVTLGGVAVVVALLAHRERVVGLHQALDPGIVGGAVLTLGQAGAMPNLVLYAVAWLAGPGFAVGVGTSVTPAGSTLGLLPLVPVLAAVPPAGALPGVLWGVVLLPVLVGVGTGWFVAARCAGDVPVRAVVLDALTAAALAAGGLTLALAAAGGSAGPGLLDAVGPSPWKVGLALAAELGAGAGAAAWLVARRGPRH